METGCPITWRSVGESKKLICMKDYLKLVRLPNLVIIALVQLAIFFLVITPVSNVAGVPTDKVFPDALLVCLVLATVFTAAGGYAINDYFDVKIDEINHPLTHLVGRSIPKHAAMTVFIVCSVLGAVLGAVIGVYAWIKLEAPFSVAFTYVLLFLIIAGILWFYSSSYKRIFVLGNLFASALNALVPMLVVVCFNFFLSMKYGANPEIVAFSRYLLAIVAIFSVCVFLWTFVAEVAIDFEEEKGDRELECHSFPIVWGHTPARIIMFAAIILVNLFCAHVVFRMLPYDPMISLRYYFCAVLAPSIAISFLLAKANTRQDYKNVSLVAYAIMLLSVTYSIVFYISYDS